MVFEIMFLALLNRYSVHEYEVTFSEYGEPGFSRVFARFTARKHGGLISYFQMSRDDYGVLYLLN